MYNISKIIFKCSENIKMEYDIDNDEIRIEKNGGGGVTVPYADIHDVVEYIKETPLVED